MGDEGLYLTSFAGIYHPQRVPIVLTPAYKRGAIPGPSKTEASKIGMKVFTSAETPDEWERVESRWWSDWSTEEDGLLVVESLATGLTRTQPVRLETYPSDPFDFEPETEMDWTMPVISYDPGWRGSLLKSSATGTGLTTIKLANPGDLEAWPQFAGDPVAGLRLPDGLGGARVPLPDDMDPSEGEWLVVTDQLDVAIENMADTQLVARMAGLLFRNPIPAGTPVTEVEIELGPTPTTVRAYLEPLYERPWG